MKLHSVEAYLIEPLKAYFEKEPKAGFEAHIVEKLEGTDPRVLERAVEWIKSNRQAQSSFPSPKECFAAVEAAKGIDELSDAKGQVQFAEGMTYGDKLKLWAEKVKRAQVIKKGSFEWREWEIYFLSTGNAVQYPVMKSRDVWTVPTKVPEQFDRNYDWAKGATMIEGKDAEAAYLDNPARREFVVKELARIRY